MRLTSRLKAAGYLTSMVSVCLLGVVAWKSATKDPVLLACLIGGMITSLLGMELRWRSHRVQQKRKDSAR
ncbi:hypothetical protein ACFO0A_01025 [Novosphingobium tardum]|uniref:Uncharacterized protein n=1 Tax=Novosphingobium tardum TaxID=1538021 RepID=A0ABV8RKN0_9SPHN